MPRNHDHIGHAHGKTVNPRKTGRQKRGETGGLLLPEHGIRKERPRRLRDFLLLLWSELRAFQSAFSLLEKGLEPDLALLRILRHGARHVEGDTWPFGVLCQREHFISCQYVHGRRLLYDHTGEDHLLPFSLASSFFFPGRVRASSIKDSASEALQGNASFYEIISPPRGGTKGEGSERPVSGVGEGKALFPEQSQAGPDCRGIVTGPAVAFYFGEGLFDSTGRAVRAVG